jgi:2-desacetyl-2-hydroxyethyl bacteriochlorophyllide A dehydrogenase
LNIKFKGKAVFWDGNKKLRNGELFIDKVKSNQAVVEVKYCGICGTDIAIYNGVHPRAKPPLIMGHEFSGLIRYSSNKKFKEGDRVVINPLISCGNCEPCRSGIPYICKNLKLIGIDIDGGFSKYVIVSNDKILKLPEGFDLKTASLAEPFATGFHVLNRIDIDKNELLLITGGGPIGTGIGLILKARGFNNIYFSEVSDFRINILKNFGFNVFNPLEVNISDCIKEKYNGNLFGILIEASGKAGPLLDMSSLVKVRGKIMLVGISHKPALVNTMNIVFKELELLGNRVYSNDDFNNAVDFVCKEKKILENYITEVLELNRLKEAINLAQDSESAMKVVVKIE